LWGEEGEFLTVSAAVPTAKATTEVDEHESDYLGEESGDEPNKIEAQHQTVVDITTE